MATQTQTLASSPSLLQRALLVDGAGCITSGLLFTVGANPISNFAGVPNPIITLMLGLVVLAYGVSVFIPGLRRGDLRGVGWWGVIVNDLSLLLCIFVLAANPLPLTDAGRWIVVLLAAFVGVIGVVQFFGVRRLKG